MSTIPECPVCGGSGETYDLNGEPGGACQGDCQIILPIADWTRLAGQQARIKELERVLELIEVGTRRNTGRCQDCETAAGVARAARLKGTPAC